LFLSLSLYILLDVSMCLSIFPSYSQINSHKHSIIYVNTCFYVCFSLYTTRSLSFHFIFEFPYHYESICVHVFNILNFNVCVYMALGTISLHIIQHFLLCMKFVCIHNNTLWVFNWSKKWLLSFSITIVII